MQIELPAMTPEGQTSEFMVSDLGELAILELQQVLLRLPGGIPAGIGCALCPALELSVDGPSFETSIANETLHARLYCQKAKLHMERANCGEKIALAELPCHEPKDIDVYLKSLVTHGDRSGSWRVEGTLASSD